jgi:poly-gamma-glutamate synthesis protein (capsule biosynthesis protein)
MIGRRRQVALVLTAVLVAAAACANQERRQSARNGAPAPTATAAPGFVLVATGDIVPQASVIDRASYDADGIGYDFRPMLSGAGPAVRDADLALCHLGAVYATAVTRPGSLSVHAPPQIAQDLADTGYDGCATASDHALDDGAAGILRTLDAMDEAGLRHAGTARTEDEARYLTVYQAGPAKVAHLSYTHGTGGRPLPAGQPWAVGLMDPGRVIDDARAARQAGADVVVVSVHWGAEGRDAPDEAQLDLARRLTAATTGGRPDIDLILGTHAHVPQPYEKVNGTWVVYGLGDQIAGETADGHGTRDPRRTQSTLGRFTFAPPALPGGRWQVTRAEFVPQMYDVDAGRVVDVNRAIADGAELAGVRDRIRDVVLSRGAAGDGLVMAE